MRHDRKFTVSTAFSQLPRKNLQIMLYGLLTKWGGSAQGLPADDHKMLVIPRAVRAEESAAGSGRLPVVKFSPICGFTVRTSLSAGNQQIPRR
jgi:hypothetical protein